MKINFKEVYDNKKIVLGLTLILVILITITGIMIYKHKQQVLHQNEVEEQIGFVEKVTVEVYSDVKISDVIKNPLIEIVEDTHIKTDKLTEEEVKFKYSYQKEIFSKKIKVEVVDTTKPKILASSSYTVNKGTKRDFINYILAGDNYDDSPIREIIGDYDLNKVGTYSVTYHMKDHSGNEASKKFKIKVVEPKKGSSSSSTSSQVKRINFDDVIKQYKNETTEIGIDVSRWQGNIDFKKVKEAGCEFVMIRLGYQDGFEGDMYLDKYFEQNIKRANEIGLKVGVYVYTYAKSEKDAKKQAKWVIEQLKPYKVELGVSFDWERWNSFSELNLSFRHFSDIANVFLDELKNKGYQGMLYSSKYYLENIWTGIEHDVWLAHYTTKTNYQGKYEMWQMTSNGKIDGIEDAVDIDIRYK